jgi:hypothetical protein
MPSDSKHTGWEILLQLSALGQVLKKEKVQTSTTSDLELGVVFVLEFLTRAILVLVSGVCEAYSYIGVAHIVSKFNQY